MDIIRESNATTCILWLVDNISHEILLTLIITSLLFVILLIIILILIITLSLTWLYVRTTFSLTSIIIYILNCIRNLNPPQITPRNQHQPTENIPKKNISQPKTFPRSFAKKTPKQKAIPKLMITDPIVIRDSPTPRRITSKDSDVPFYPNRVVRSMIKLPRFPSPKVQLVRPKAAAKSPPPLLYPDLEPLNNWNVSNSSNNNSETSSNNFDLNNNLSSPDRSSS